MKEAITICLLIVLMMGSKIDEKKEFWRTIHQVRGYWHE